MTGARSWWLLAAGGVAIVVGIGRLVLDVSASVLATTVSCGNAEQWIAGTGPAHTTGSLHTACGTALHNASVEGALALAGGIVLLLAWIVVAEAWWPLIVLTAFAVLTVGAVFGYAGSALFVAIMVLVVFAAFRVVLRIHSTSNRQGRGDPHP